MRMRGISGLLIAAGLGLGALDAQTVPVEWLRAEPGAREIAAMAAGAKTYGWPAMARALRAAALDSYQRSGASPATAAWRNTARWAGAETLAKLDGATDANSADSSAPTAPPWRDWLVADAALSAAFLALEQPVDNRAVAVRILDELRAAEPESFAEYTSLALAIALVYDQQPTREWPHWQVTEEALPRRLPEPTRAFRYFVELDLSGRSLHRLSQLGAAELRFLVDIVAPMDELEWVAARIRTPLAKLDETYEMVNYRQDRIVMGAYVWGGKPYTLDAILGEGGICVDQAYFATQAGKARGVPTLLFGGAGRDGRHAWFGFLGTGRNWRMDAGRYEEQNYVTGMAIDPQTWDEISDHELAFLSEGFRREKSAREAALHAGFARWLREDGRLREAQSAARAAVRLERRELAAWDTLLALEAQPGAARETLAREAASGLSSYPELNAHYMGVVIESLGARGETAEADRLGRELARRFAGRRGDLSVAQVARQVEAAATQPIKEQLKQYRSLMRRFGRGAGTAMWDEVARPLVVRLADGGRWREAREALAVAREALVGSGGTQLDMEMRAMAAALTKAERATAEGNTK